MLKATTAEFIVVKRNVVWLTRTLRRKPAKERWDQSNLEMVVAVPWRKIEDDPKMDGERLKSEVVTMDKKYREKLEAEEHVPVPNRVYISRENLEKFGFTVRCPGCMSLLWGTARQAHTENCRRRIEEELKGTAKAASATRRVKGYQDRAAAKGTTARMEEDARASSSNDGGNMAQAQSSSSSASTTKMSGHGRGDGCKETSEKRKAEEEHSEDPERGDGKWMRTEGNRRN